MRYIYKYNQFTGFTSFEFYFISQKRTQIQTFIAYSKCVKFLRVWQISARSMATKYIPTKRKSKYDD